MVSDVGEVSDTLTRHRVSIRFEVRGGFRLWVVVAKYAYPEFQSALRFAVVSDCLLGVLYRVEASVSIRFEVRGGFRLDDDELVMLK